MTEPRAKDRRVGILVRMSPEEKALLQERATAEGLSLQVLGEQLLLGKHTGTRAPGRVPKTHTDTELPLTG